MSDPLARLPRWLGPRFEFAVRCALFALDDIRKGYRYRRGQIAGNPGVRHAELSVAQSTAYIEGVFGEYKRYSGISRFRGRAAELGPGDNCGVGLLFLADGCEHVDLIDRFYSARDPRHHAEIYRALFDAHPSLASRFRGVDLTDEASFPDVTRHYGPGAMLERFFVDHGPYDVIVSRAVLEHATDPLRGLEQMAESLAPGGVMLHEVDLRDHEMFSTRFHELKFLEIPDWLYTHMVRHSGRPNRIRSDKYVAVLGSLGLDVSLYVTRLAGVGDIVPYAAYETIPKSLRDRSAAYISSIRHAFSRSLRRVSDENLSITGFFVVARKPI